MPASKQLAYLGAVTLALAAIVKSAQVALTPEFRIALQIVGAALIENVVVQALLVTIALVGLLSLCVAAWEKAERRAK